MSDPASYFEYSGNIHVHSIYSDGACGAEEIAGIASKLGRDFIIINDHSYMTDDLHKEKEGFYGNVLVMMGLEIGKESHHYLACNIKEMETGENLSPQQVIDVVNGQGGFGFVAHPFEKGMPFKENSVAFTWDDLSVTGFTGIEIWNFSSRWKERVKGPLQALFFLLFKTLSLKGPSEDTLSWWDELCLKRRVVAIGGPDAHGVRFKLGPIFFTPLSYPYLLNSVNVHILLEDELSEDFKTAERQIYGAMREGSLYVAHGNLAPSRGFRFVYLPDDGKCIPMGGEGRFSPGIFTIETPRKCTIRIIRNGAELESRRGKTMQLKVEEPGVYRIEAHYRTALLGLRPWIFSNPVYLR